MPYFFKEIMDTFYLNPNPSIQEFHETFVPITCELWTRKHWKALSSTYWIFLYAGHLKIYSISVCLAPPFGIPIDLTHNTHQKINAHSSKRAKHVCIYIMCMQNFYIYIYIYIYIIKNICIYIYILYTLWSDIWKQFAQLHSVWMCMGQNPPSCWFVPCLSKYLLILQTYPKQRWNTKLVLDNFDSKWQEILQGN